MPGSESRSGASAPRTVEQVIARVQRLCDVPRAAGVYPLADDVEAWLLGDISAISAAAICCEAAPSRAR